MSEPWSTERWEQAIRAVFRRALTDAEFRARALADARAAFQEANGVPPPEGVAFRFAEALQEQVYVLPQAVVPVGELSEIDVARILHHSFRQQSLPPPSTR